MTGKILSGKALYSLILSGAFLFIAASLFASVNISRNSLDAYKAVLTLKFSEAEKLIAADRKINPENIFDIYIEDYRDFLSAFICDEEKIISLYKKSHSRRIESIKHSGEKSSPFFRYFLGNMSLQNSLLNLKDGNYFNSSSGISSAKGYFEENQKLFPAFIPGYTGLGLIHIITGSLPDQYKGIASVAGLSGDIDQGVAELRKVSEWEGSDEFTKISRTEAVFYLAFTGSAFSADKSVAVRLFEQISLKDDVFPAESNPLVIFAGARTYMQAGMNDKALVLLGKYSPATDQFPFYVISFLRGKAMLNKIDPEAGFYFKSFVTHYRGHTWVKSAYQRLAWISLLEGDNKKYELYRSMTRLYGNENAENDRQAMREISSPDPVSVPLLKARLLFDGGYYNLALSELLDKKNVSLLTSKKDNLEYNYRLGRIYQELGDYNNAMSYFDKTISKGSSEPWYFAANAALQCGIIMENKGNYQAAIGFYKRCLSIRSSEYKTSLDQKAKAGIKRVEKILR